MEQTTSNGGNHIIALFGWIYTGVCVLASITQPQITYAAQIFMYLSGGLCSIGGFIYYVSEIRRKKKFVHRKPLEKIH